MIKARNMFYSKNMYYANIMPTFPLLLSTLTDKILIKWEKIRIKKRITAKFGWTTRIAGDI